ncbi:MAG: hypothetical protein IK096_04445 [Lachnospiraceae bacterium]|nr:hypothetical protein [Lachnospiraceae bacterium]
METLRNYLNSMFERYPETPEAERAKAELWQMMEDKYNELVADGKKENEAVGIVISEFGDLSEVADSLGISTMLAKMPQAAKEQEEAEPVQETVKAKSATNVFEEAERKFAETTDAIWRDVTGQDKASGGETASSGTADTGKTGAWWTWHNEASTAGAESADNVYRYLTAILSVYWQTVTCIYLCWSFLTFRWWITWIIWPLAAVLHSVLKRLVLGDVTARDGRTYRNRLVAAVLESYWPCVVFVYFAVSFLTGMWPITWLIFVIAPFMRKVLQNMALGEEAAE